MMAYLKLTFGKIIPSLIVDFKSPDGVLLIGDPNVVEDLYVS